MSVSIRLEANAKYPVLLSDDRIDHHAWWKRIMYRVKRGDKTLTAAQVGMAKEAANGSSQADE